MILLIAEHRLALPRRAAPRRAPCAASVQLPAGRTPSRSPGGYRCGWSGFHVFPFSGEDSLHCGTSRQKTAEGGKSDITSKRGKERTAFYYSERHLQMNSRYRSLDPEKRLAKVVTTYVYIYMCMYVIIYIVLLVYILMVIQLLKLQKVLIVFTDICKYLGKQRLTLRARCFIIYIYISE